MDNPLIFKHRYVTIRKLGGVSMSNTTQILEYKCPCCDAGLPFDEKTQKMSCEYCGNEFELEAVKAYNASLNQTDTETVEWDATSSSEWNEDETSAIRTFSCPSCGGVLLTDDNTAATFCPYCMNPTILPGRLSGGLKPDAVIPFQTGKDDARDAFMKLCKGKPLLPKEFMTTHKIENITGMYVPFWLYDCGSSFRGNYRATKVRHWSDSNYNYTKTSYYHLVRGATADFSKIPMDASIKMDDAIMESIEPYDYSQIIDFETAYLSGFLADKYDVESNQGEGRIRERVNSSYQELLAPSMIGYASVIPTSRNLNITHSKAHYVLLPVWILSTKYKDQTYLFAMNGQTGKMTGKFPICPKRSWAWFSGISAAVTALVALIQLLVL